MKCILGSTSQRKVEIVRKVLGELVRSDMDVKGFEVKSRVPETPWNEETVIGARNRAMFCRELGEDADYFLGLESGLVERYGHIYEEAWAVVFTPDGKEFSGYSSGLKVPDFILKKMEQHNLPHYQIFAEDINSDTWAQYSGELLLREVSLEESVRNAFVQIFAPEKSFYKRK
jgi:non-canonical (house-cleaning) NTP pyrophosphatase